MKTNAQKQADLAASAALLDAEMLALKTRATGAGWERAEGQFDMQPLPQLMVDSVVLTCAASLRPQPVSWLWQYWLAMGKLHVLAGAPGQGKTTIALAMMATVTIGGRWPDGSHCDAGNAIFWSGEDDPADTLVPRLMAAGADMARCFFIEGARRDGEVVPFDPARDLGQLLAAIEKIGGIKLLVIDPVVSAVTGDSHKNTEVRRALQPLVELAAACECAVLGITHFAKGGQGSDPSQRVVGSVAFTAVARVVLVAAKVQGDDGDKDARILARSKSNIGPDDGGFQYDLEQTELLPGIQASRIAWGKAVQGSARELLTDPNEMQQDDADVTAKDEAEEFLLELLKDGSAPSKHVETEAKDAGIAWRTVRRASDSLGIKKRKLNGAWYWFRPESLPATAENSNLAKQLVQLVQHSNLGQVGQVDGQVDFSLLSSNTEEGAEDSEDSYFGSGESSESSGTLESSGMEVLQ